MALIPCNNCEYPISDAAAECPKCSYKTGALIEAADTENFKCPECHKTLSQKTDACPNCAYPLNILSAEIPKSEQIDLSSNTPKKMSKKTLIIGCSVVVIVLLALIYSISIKNKSSSISQNTNQKGTSQTTNAAAPKSTKIVYISELSAMVHKEPTINSEVVLKAHINESLESTGKTHQDGENNWIQVKVQTTEKVHPGWVREAFISSETIEQKIFSQEQCIVVSHKKICVGDNLSETVLKNLLFLEDSPQGRFFYNYDKNTKEYSGISIGVEDDIIDSINITRLTNGNLTNKEEQEHYLQNHEKIKNDRILSEEYRLREAKTRFNTLSKPFWGQDEYGIKLGISVEELDNILIQHFSGNYFCWGQNISFDDNNLPVVLENLYSQFECTLNTLNSNKIKPDDYDWSGFSTTVYVYENKVSGIGMSLGFSAIGALKSYNSTLERTERQKDYKWKPFIHDPIQNDASKPDANNNDTQTPEQQSIKKILTRWQDIKRQAFVNGDTSGLSSVLTGKALSDTEGGVKWWQSNGEYHSITLNSLDFLDTQVNGSSASVRVRISETKHNSVEGNKTSTYNATYGLEKRGDNWYISSVAAE